MATQKIRIKNHYVPKLYLKQWMNSDRKIQTYSLIVPHENIPFWKKYSLDGISYREHLYTHITDSEEEVDTLEHWLNQNIESPAQESIKLAVSDSRMSPKHWENLIRFAVLQDIRTPAYFRNFLNRQKSTINAAIENIINEVILKLKIIEGKNLPIDDHSVSTEDFPIRTTITKNSTGDGEIHVNGIVGRKLWHWVMKHHLIDTIKNISTKNWTIYHAPSGMNWPTSDNPLIRLNYINEKNI